jgi:hypothetical protein
MIFLSDNCKVTAENCWAKTIINKNGDRNFRLQEANNGFPKQNKETNSFPHKEVRYSRRSFWDGNVWCFSSTWIVWPTTDYRTRWWLASHHTFNLQLNYLMGTLDTLVEKSVHHLIIYPKAIHRQSTRKRHCVQLGCSFFVHWRSTGRYTAAAITPFSEPYYSLDQTGPHHYVMLLWCDILPSIVWCYHVINPSSCNSQLLCEILWTTTNLVSADIALMMKRVNTF